MGHVTANVDQSAYRVRDDDGSESAATWLEVINTSHDFDVSAGNVDFRLRVNLAENGGADAANQSYTLQFDINGGGYNTLTGASTGCIFYDSTNLTNNTDTTEQLSQGGTFVGTGGQCEDGVVDAFVLGANNDLEAEYTVRLVSADLSDTDSINFQVLEADTYGVTANVTITKGAGPTLQSISGSITPTGALVKFIDFTSLVGSISASGAATKAITLGTALIGSIAASGSLQQSLVFLQSVAGSSTPVGAILKQTNKVISGVITGAGNLVKQVNKVLVGGITIIGVNVLSVLKGMSGTITATGALQAAYNTIQSIVGVVTSSGVLTAILSGPPTVARFIRKKFMKMLGRR